MANPLKQYPPSPDGYGGTGVTAVVDGSDGDVVERYAYDPYGRVTVLNGEDDADGGGVSDWSADADNVSDWDNRIGYCGYRLDPETGANGQGIMHVRHRPYLPPLGRWITRDPKDQDTAGGGYHDGMGLYEYAGTRPSGAIDPEGLEIVKDLPPEFERAIARVERDYNALPRMRGPGDMHEHWYEGSGRPVRLGDDLMTEIKRTDGYQNLRWRLFGNALKEVQKRGEAGVLVKVSGREDCTAKVTSPGGFALAVAVGSFELRAGGFCAVWSDEEVSQTPGRMGYCKGNGKTDGWGYLTYASCDFAFWVEDKWTYRTYRDFVDNYGDDAFGKVLAGIKQGGDAVLATVDWSLHSVDRMELRRPSDFLWYAWWREQAAQAEAHCECP